MIEIKSGIYRITFKGCKSKRFYIGSAVNFRKRFECHLSDFRSNTNNRKLQNAYNKYGEQSIAFEIIEYCDVDSLIIREQYYLDTLLFAQQYLRKEDTRFNEFGYNISPTAGSNLGAKHSQKANVEKSKRQTGKKIKPCSEDKKIHLSNINLGKQLSQKTKDLIGVASSERGQSTQTRELLSELKQGNQAGNKKMYALNLQNGVFVEYLKRNDAAVDFKCDPATIGRYIKLETEYKGHLLFYEEGYRKNKAA